MEVCGRCGAWRRGRGRGNGSKGRASEYRRLDATSVRIRHHGGRRTHGAAVGKPGTLSTANAACDEEGKNAGRDKRKEAKHDDDRDRPVWEGRTAILLY